MYKIEIIEVGPDGHTRLEVPTRDKAHRARLLARIREVVEEEAAIETPACDACGGRLIDVYRMPGPAQRICPTSPPRVWAACAECENRQTVLASKRWLLDAP